MFVRTKPSPKSPRKTVLIVKDERHGNKSKQRIVCYLDVANSDQEVEKLKALAHEYIARWEQDKKDITGQQSFVEAPAIEDIGKNLPDFVSFPTDSA